MNIENMRELLITLAWRQKILQYSTLCMGSVETDAIMLNTGLNI